MCVNCPVLFCKSRNIQSAFTSKPFPTMCRKPSFFQSTLCWALNACKRAANSQAECCKYALEVLPKCKLVGTRPGCSSVRRKSTGANAPEHQMGWQNHSPYLLLQHCTLSAPVVVLPCWWTGGCGRQGKALAVAVIEPPPDVFPAASSAFKMGQIFFVPWGLLWTACPGAQKC